MSGVKSRPINEILTDLVLQTVFVFAAYFIVSSFSYFNLPKISELVVNSLQIRADPNKMKQFINLLQKSVVVATFMAVVIGTFSAVAREKKLIPWLGRKFWLFQSHVDDSAWKTTFESGSNECWIQVDTKGGIRYVGLGHSVSWDHKDGGIGLSSVKMYDEAGASLDDVAEYIYIPTEEINGPILFIKANNKKETI